MTSERTFSWKELLQRLQRDVEREGELSRDSPAWKVAEAELRRLATYLLRQFRPPDAEDVDDLVQEVLLKLQSRRVLRRIRAAGSPEGYIVVLMRNALVDRLRSWEREQEWLRHATQERGREARNIEELITLRGLLEELSAEERELIRMRFWENLTFQEIADRLGIRYSAASKRLLRLLKRLREGLE